MKVRSVVNRREFLKVEATRGHEDNIVVNVSIITLSSAQARALLGSDPG